MSGVRTVCCGRHMTAAACVGRCSDCPGHSFTDVGPLLYTLNEEQSAHFMHAMMNPKPPTESMKAAARQLAAWKRMPGDLEYDSWASSLSDITPSQEGNAAPDMAAPHKEKK